MKHSSPLPPKQSWDFGEVPAVTEKVVVRNNANCLMKRPTLLLGKGIRGRRND